MTTGKLLNNTVYQILMKDQNAIHEEETQDQKWNRGLDLYIESVQKPDHALRGCAHNQKCYNELMEIRDMVIDLVKDIPNPHAPKLKPGDKNNAPSVKSFSGSNVSSGCFDPAN